MDIGKLTYYSRKIHRISLFFVVILGLVQMGTGITMLYPTLFAFIDQSQMLSIHMMNAGIFTIAFGIQMITGIIMYVTPWLVKRQLEKRNQP